MGGITPGWGLAGGDVAGVSDPVGRVAGVAGFPGSVSPVTTEGARSARGDAGDK